MILKTVSVDPNVYLSTPLVPVNALDCKMMPTSMEPAGTEVGAGKVLTLVTTVPISIFRLGVLKG